MAAAPAAAIPAPVLGVQVERVVVAARESDTVSPVIDEAAPVPAPIPAVPSCTQEPEPMRATNPPPAIDGAQGSPPLEDLLALGISPASLKHAGSQA